MELNFEIGLSDGARKDLGRLSKKDKERVLKKLVLLGKEDSNNVKKLKGDFDGYSRLRIGKIRVIFEVLSRERKILVEYIGFRGSVYRD